MTLRHTAAAALLAACTLAAAPALAQNSIDLSRYTLTRNVALDTLGEVGLEASAVAYARDRGTLFFVGDEGLGVVEISLSGQALSSMTFSAWPSRTTHNDAEGLAYLGNGVLVVGEERIQDAFRFSYVAGGSVNLATAAWSSVANWSYNNSGMEGISFDPRDGSFAAVKQTNPQMVLTGTLAFESDADGGASTMSTLFSASSLFGLSNLSDVQTLSPVDALAGTPAADNLLLLSLGSKRLVEVSRSGQVMSSLDLSSFTRNDIEGVTIDELGRIYLVAEDSGFGNSRLLVLTAVPEPATWAMWLTGIAGLTARGATRRRARYA